MVYCETVEGTGAQKKDWLFFGIFFLSAFIFREIRKWMEKKLYRRVPDEKPVPVSIFKKPRRFTRMLILKFNWTDLNWGLRWQSSTEGYVQQLDGPWKPAALNRKETSQKFCEFNLPWVNPQTTRKNQKINSPQRKEMHGLWERVQCYGNETETTKKNRVPFVPMGTNLFLLILHNI